MKKSSNTTQPGCVTQILPGRTRDILYCVPKLFNEFDISIPNIRYDSEGFTNLCGDFGITLAIKDSFSTFIFGSEGRKYVLTINDTHTHASALQLGELQSEMDMYIDNLNVGSKKRGKKLMEELALVEAIKPKAAFAGKYVQSKALTAADKEELRKKYVKSDKYIALSQGRKQSGKRIRLNKPAPLKAMNRQIAESVTNNNGMARIASLANQLTLPYNQNNLIRFPDGIAAKTALNKSWVNNTISPTVYGNCSFLSLIHSGMLNAQYYVNIPYTPAGAFTFELANFARRDAQGSGGLIDSNQAEAKSILSAGFFNNTTLGTLIVPLRTGVCVDKNYTARMIAFSVPVDSDGNDVVLPGTYSNNMGACIPFVAGSSSDNIEFKLILDITTGGTTTLTATLFGFNGSTAFSTTMATATMTGGPNQTWSFAYNASATGVNTCDRLSGISLKLGNGGAQSVTLKELNVSLLTSLSGAPWPLTNLFLPLSTYVGIPCQTYAALSSIVQSSRTVGSSMLITDMSNRLTIAGTMTAAQISAGLPPAESGIYSQESLSRADGVMVSEERKGLYSAPFRFRDLLSRNFVDSNFSWTGDTTYTYVIMKVPLVAGVSVRLQVCDIFELQMEAGQQILPVSETIADLTTVAIITKAMLANQVLTCNPTHMEFLKIFKENFLGAYKKLRPAIELLSRAHPVAGAAYNLVDKLLT